MWDALLTIGNGIFIPSLLPAIVDSRAFIPRQTSGLAIIAITLAFAGLLGQGLVFSPIIVAVIGLLWAFIFLFRSNPAVP